MSVEQLESKILALSPEDRRELAEWFEIHRDKLLNGVNENPDVRAELELRLKEINEHPEILESFDEEDLEQMFEEIANERAKKTSARKG